MNTEYPPEFKSVLATLVGQPQAVIEMWTYALAMIMIDEGKARVIGTNRDGEHLHLVIQPDAGEMFEVVRPQMSESLEREFLKQVRRIVAQEAKGDR